MDKNHIAQRLKKYLFLISIIFLVMTSSHLIYSYIYSDAKETAIKWGSISEAIIWPIPNLNPLKNNSDQNKYINSILYRSLLKYDISKKKIVWDITKCDISNLLQIECFLNDNIKWSNGENITQDDILKTFETLKADNLNPIMFSLLKNTTFQKTQTSIVFKNTKKDINFLKIFFQPIVSSKVLNIISKKELEWSFSLPNWIYSWKYKVANISKDKSLDITTLALEKNKEYYKNPVYIDTILFKIFPNVKDFIRNKGSINIFNDKDNLISWTIPRLEEKSYILPQYVSLFFNTEKLVDSNLRWLISQEINSDDIIKELGENKFQKVTNPFISNAYVEEPKVNSDFKKIFAEKKYFSPNEIIKELEGDILLLKETANTNTYSWEAQIKTISWEVTINPTPAALEEKYTVETLPNPKSNIIVSPNWVDAYNFISKSNILLKGKVPAWVSEVYINDYKLQWYTPGATTFYYRISTEKNTLKLGANSYKIYFTKDNKKDLSEEIHFYYSTDKGELKKAEAEALEKKVLVKTEEIKKSTENTSSNTDLITQSQKNKKEISDIEQKILKAKELNSNYFYNKDLEKYSLELYYIVWKSDYKKTAEYIKKVLESKGFDIQLRELTTQNLNTLLTEKKKNYDMLLAWVNLSYFDFNIYPYFHSSQIESGYNFSNFRKLDLDIILEELKSKLLSPEKILTLEKKALKIINENHLSKTIYTPILSNLVDKNIKWYNLEKNIPENIYRFEPLEKSYVHQDKFIITENKDIIGYIKYLINTLF